LPSAISIALLPAPKATATTPNSRSIRIAKHRILPNAECFADFPVAEIGTFMNYFRHYTHEIFLPRRKVIDPALQADTWLGVMPHGLRAIRLAND
jgi:hypothetical protein